MGKIREKFIFWIFRFSATLIRSYRPIRVPVNRRARKKNSSILRIDEVWHDRGIAFASRHMYAFIYWCIVLYVICKCLCWMWEMKSRYLKMDSSLGRKSSSITINMAGTRHGGPISYSSSPAWWNGEVTLAEYYCWNPPQKAMKFA